MKETSARKFGDKLRKLGNRNESTLVSGLMAYLVKETRVVPNDKSSPPDERRLVFSVIASPLLAHLYAHWYEYRDGPPILYALTSDVEYEI